MIKCMGLSMQKEDPKIEQTFYYGKISFLAHPSCFLHFTCWTLS